MRRCSTLLALLAAFSAVIFAGSANGSGGNGYAFGQNVDPSLVNTINASQTSGNGTPSSLYHVLVFGHAPDLSHADSSTGVVGAQSLTVTAAQAAQLSSQPGVQFITTDAPMAPTSNGSSSSSSALSAANLATLYPQVDGAPALWSAGDTGQGQGIAVIDSGVTPRADFGTRLVQVALPTQDGTQLNDSVGHGSAVAGIAAGQSSDGKYIGIAPGATLYAINVARADGVYTSDVIAGLMWVLQNAKAKNIGVVNLSLSQTTPSSYYTNTLDSVIDLLWKQGIVVVVSSGNFGPDSEQFAPANDPWAITGGASDLNDTATTADDSLAVFSSYGTTPDRFSKPDIVAPGRHIVTTIPADSSIAQSAPAGYLVGSGEDNYVRISGTSFSAPQVTGAVALLLQQRPSLSPDQVKWILTQSENDLPGSDAGTLNLAGVTSALAHPDDSNKGYRWSNSARPNSNTNDFLTTLGNYQQIFHDELDAATKDIQAKLSCLKATLTPPPAPPKGKAATAPVPNPAFADCANHLDAAAAAWDKAANEWSSAGAPQMSKASDDETNAGNDWTAAATNWTTAGNTQSSSADTANAAAAWDHAAA